MKAKVVYLLETKLEAVNSSSIRSVWSRKNKDMIYLDAISVAALQMEYWLYGINEGVSCGCCVGPFFSSAYLANLESNCSQAVTTVYGSNIPPRVRRSGANFSVGARWFGGWCVGINFNVIKTPKSRSLVISLLYGLTKSILRKQKCNIVNVWLICLEDDHLLVNSEVERSGLLHYHGLVFSR